MNGTAKWLDFVDGYSYAVRVDDLGSLDLAFPDRWRRDGMCTGVLSASEEASA